MLLMYMGRAGLGVGLHSGMTTTNSRMNSIHAKVGRLEGG